MIAAVPIMISVRRGRSRVTHLRVLRTYDTSSKNARGKAQNRKPLKRRRPRSPPRAGASEGLFRRARARKRPWGGFWAKRTKVVYLRHELMFKNQCSRTRQAMALLSKTLTVMCLMCM